MALNGNPDRDLVDAVLAGDADAYRALVDRESRSVFGLCLSILGDADDAQDVAQDAFVQAYRSLPGYRADGTFGAWIGRIARRMAIARAAERRHRQMETPGLEMHAADDHANPERQVVSHESSEQLRIAINSLPAEQRDVVMLRFYQDMPIEGIALATRTPIGTVKSRLHRALARLRDQGDLRPLS